MAVSRSEHKEPLMTWCRLLSDSVHEGTHWLLDGWFGVEEKVLLAPGDIGGIDQRESKTRSEFFHGGYHLAGCTKAPGIRTYGPFTSSAYYMYRLVIKFTKPFPGSPSFGGVSPLRLTFRISHGGVSNFPFCPTSLHPTQ